MDDRSQVVIHENVAKISLVPWILTVCGTLMYRYRECKSIWCCNTTEIGGEHMENRIAFSG